MITGLGQVKTTGVDNGQRGLRIFAAVAFQHSDLLAVYSGRGGHELVLQVFLGMVGDTIGAVDLFRVTRVVLNQTQDITFVDRAGVGSIRAGNINSNGIFQQCIAVVGSQR